jgi:hypothetical protein
MAVSDHVFFGSADATTGRDHRQRMASARTSATRPYSV